MLSNVHSSYTVKLDNLGWVYGMNQTDNNRCVKRKSQRPSLPVPLENTPCSISYKSYLYFIKVRGVNDSGGAISILAVLSVIVEIGGGDKWFQTQNVSSVRPYPTCVSVSGSITDNHLVYIRSDQYAR